MDDETFVRDRIRQAREDMGLSQREMARLYNVSQSKISDIERGRVQVTATQLLQLARLLHKPITYFFPSRTDGLTVDLEARLLDILRSLPDDWQQRVLSNVEREAELFRRIAPYIRAGIPDEFYGFLLQEEWQVLEAEDTVAEGISTDKELAAENARYDDAYQRYVKWRNETKDQKPVDHQQQK